MSAVLVDRKEDMSPDGYLRLCIEDDGDVCIQVCEFGGLHGDEFNTADVQFCTIGSGGGRSPRTFMALRQLALAMALALDNQEAPEGLQEFDGKELIERLK